jgi:hypothetical protein
LCNMHCTAGAGEGVDPCVLVRHTGFRLPVSSRDADIGSASEYMTFA